MTTRIVKTWPLTNNVGGPYPIYEHATLIFLDDGSVHWTLHEFDEKCDQSGCFVCGLAYGENDEALAKEREK